MDNMIETAKRLFSVYNDFFWLLIIIIILIAVIKGLSIYQGNDKNKKMSFSVVLRIGIKKIIDQIVVFIIFNFIIVMCIEISIFHWLLEEKLIKLLIGIAVFYDLYYSHKVYGRLRFDDFLDDIEVGKYVYSPTQQEYENLIIEYRSSFELIKEKQEIIKSLTPISVITVIAGYVLKGEDIVINWNGCTIVFVLIIIAFAWALYDNYKKMCIVRGRWTEVEKRLNKIKNKTEKELDKSRGTEKSNR